MEGKSEEERYRKIRVLGEGSVGKAYLVEATHDRQLYVMKRIFIGGLSEENKENAKREAVLHNMLMHPNIITFREVYHTTSDKLCIIMEFAEGGDLDKFILAQNGRPLEEDRILKMFSQICLGLRAIHAKKIIHRDLKGANIFLTEDNTVKIGDFGISKSLDKTAMACQSFVGTPYYLSPEMVKGMPYTFKSDIWALGVILYHMCAYRLPFEANSLPMLAMKIMKGSYPQLTSYSKELRSLVSDLLQVNPKQRPTISKVLRKGNRIIFRHIPAEEQAKPPVAKQKPANVFDKLTENKSDPPTVSSELHKLVENKHAFSKKDTPAKLVSPQKDQDWREVEREYARKNIERQAKIEKARQEQIWRERQEQEEKRRERQEQEEKRRERQEQEEKRRERQEQEEKRRERQEQEEKRRERQEQAERERQEQKKRDQQQRREKERERLRQEKEREIQREREEREKRDERRTHERKKKNEAERRLKESGSAGIFQSRDSVDGQERKVYRTEESVEKREERMGSPYENERARPERAVRREDPANIKIQGAKQEQRGPRGTGSNFVENTPSTHSSKLPNAADCNQAGEGLKLSSCSMPQDSYSDKTKGTLNSKETEEKANRRSKIVRLGDLPKRASELTSQLGGSSASRVQPDQYSSDYSSYEKSDQEEEEEEEESNYELQGTSHICHQSRINIYEASADFDLVPLYHHESRGAQDINETDHLLQSVKPESLESIRMILEERMDRKNFIRAYNTIKTYMEDFQEVENKFKGDKTALLKSYLYNEKAICSKLFFLKQEQLSQNVRLLYTLILVDEAQTRMSRSGYRKESKALSRFL